MAVKRCCIDNCNSCSTRKEDFGVTYHKFPKDVTLRDLWMLVTHFKHTDTELPTYVCSRHFCKNDFKVFKDSKYVLKSDALPSIFPWDTITTSTMETPSSVDTDTVCEELNYKQEKQSRNSKDSEGENVEAIQKFIDEQDKEIQEQKSASNLLNDSTSDNTCEEENDNQNKKKIMIDSSVMHMILDQNVASIESKKDLMVEQKLSPIGKGNNSMALSIGSKVEVKDFSETWYCAQITEVDFEEMEVLVHCENDTKKPDEWISVNSSRLRPVGSSSVKAGPSSANSVPEDPVKEEPKEFKTKEDEKIKLTFVEGERCLARWRDNRRFLATILSNLGNGAYKILFDDGFHWSCNTSRLYKLKSTEKELTVDTNSLSSTTSTPSPGHYGAGPSDTGQGNQTIPLYPAFHTHLFDPTRDYLGSKSERREKKRKLNIKEIFNIGQKRQKTLKEPKIQMERKPRVPKRKLKKEREIKTEVKTESNAFNAVASIIGTVNNEESTTNVKVAEDKMIEPKMNIKNEIKIKTEDDDNCGVEKINNMAEEINSVDQVKDMEVDDFKADIDPVLEEEVKLEKFEKQDAIKHKEVIVRMKEVINKLEDGLIKEEKANSLKTVLKDFVQEVIINTAANELILKVTTADKQEVTTADKPEVMTAYKQEVMMTDKPEITTPGKSEVITADKPELNSADKPEVMTTHKLEVTTADRVIQKNESLKKVSKSRKSKKLRLLQEKRVKRQVEMVKNELEQMKKQVKEMRKQMLLKTQVLEKPQGVAMMPESFLLPGEWCAKWVNGQPVGTVSEIECEMKVDPNGKPPLPRRSVQVEDKRLPGGWTKHMVRRSLGHSAGKWDVVLISPDNRRFHTKNEIRIYLENNPDMDLEPYQHALTDFGIHLKLSRRMGWIIQTPDGATDGPASPLPAGSLGITSPLVKRKKLSLKKSIKALKAKEKKKRKKLTIKLKVPQEHVESDSHGQEVDDSVLDLGLVEPTAAGTFDPSPVEDGCVYVGSLKVQIIDNLLRCPAENCFKNFRNTTLLQMHIKHYHRELRKSMGATPKVLDLAYVRTKPPRIDSARRDGQKAIKVKVPRPHKELKLELKDIKSELQANMKALIPAKGTEIRIPRSQDSPKLRQALTPRPVKRPRVLLPVRRLEPEAPSPNSNEESDYEIIDPKQSLIDASMLEPLDFETEISTHTVTKPLTDKQQKGEKKRRPLVLPPKRSISEDDDWFGLNSDVETRSSFPRSGTPDSKVDAKMAPISPESNEEKEANMYMYTENGERIKIVHMKREEIINCHCGIREEDGLMVQCELCLCWQHALCHNIRRESEVPEKYTCSICLNPRRGRRWQRFLHDQDRLYEGLLPGARPCESLRRSHELSGNLLRIEDSLHALTVKYYVATKKDHPKLYLWAKDWEQLELKYTQEKLNSDYSDLNVMISDVGKENLPLKPDDVKDLPPDAASPPSEEHDRYSQRGEGPLLSGLLSSPGGASLDLPISTMELERLAKSVQDAECERPSVRAPQPEAAIENSVCRERLLKHIQRCHALIGARLESIEAQVAELESQDPSLEDDETAEFFPRSKQTVQMLMRDLNTMEELGVIT